ARHRFIGHRGRALAQRRQHQHVSPSIKVGDLLPRHAPHNFAPPSISAEWFALQNNGTNQFCMNSFRLIERAQRLQQVRNSLAQSDLTHKQYSEGSFVVARSRLKNLEIDPVWYHPCSFRLDALVPKCVSDELRAADDLVGKLPLCGLTLSETVGRVAGNI